MTNIRRYFLEKAPVFITAVCHERRAYLEAPERKELLLRVMRETKVVHPFQMLGYSILHDHFHWLLDPANPRDLPRIVQAVKLRFARRIKPHDHPGPFKTWQRRYWDHIIRDENDLQRHLDYIHYDPVKHGLVQEPGKYEWSSFRHYLGQGSYAREWGIGAPPVGIEEIEAE